MKRANRIKLNFTRNWKFPGKERISTWLKPSKELRHQLKNGITWLTDEDIAIYTTADNYIEWQILCNGTYEEDISKLIRISVPADGVALDIGGNIGLQSLRMAQAAGTKGKVIAFEPLTYLQEKFKKNVALNKIDNITLFPYALADIASEANFKFNRHAWNQGTFNLSHGDSGDESQQVLIRKGDDLPELQNLYRLDLIIIDVEGFELPVLIGLSQLISRFKPRIIFEYDANYWVNSGHDIAKCLKMLNQLDYDLYQITQVGCILIANETLPEDGNIFCIKKS